MGPTSTRPPYGRGVRWIVDGMNVIGSRPDGWWRDRHGAMVALVGDVDRWALAGQESVTVVFERPPEPPITSTVIDVRHAPVPRPNSADDEIVRLLAAAADPSDVCVVTSDSALAQRVRSVGATAHPAAAFRDLVDAR